MPTQKGLHYFDPYRGVQNFTVKNENYGKPIEWYHSFFSRSQDHQILGECTPNYFSHNNTAHDIWNYNPNVKIIAILRNPTERAFSAYLYWKQKGILGNISFHKLIRSESKTFLLGYGEYAKHLSRYFDIFPAENIHISIFEDIHKNPKNFYSKIIKFLGVDAVFNSNLLHKKTNGSKESIIPYLNHLLYKLKHKIDKENEDGVQLSIARTTLIRLLDNLIRGNSIESKKIPLMLPSDVEYLQEFYMEDITNLENLLSRNLGVWKVGYHEN